MAARQSLSCRWCPVVKGWHRWLALAVLLAFFVQRQIQVGVWNMDSISMPASFISDMPYLSTTAATTKLQDPENASFHISSHGRIQRLVNESSIISWGYKKSSGFPEELRVKYVLTPGLDITRLHELFPQEKQVVWSNVSSSSILWEWRICNAVQGFRQAGSIKPHVLLTRCNENFGDFSRHVPPDKTTNWDDKVDWSQNGCQSNEDVWEYLNHSHTRAVFTTQHHFVDHSKVHSLPLGIKHTMKVSVLKLLEQPRVPKTKLLMINDNGWKHRKKVTATVMENFAKFNVNLTNSYNHKKSSSYLRELRQSKFILAPSGLGWDCYRIWEAIHFNTIPIIERFHRPRDGWRRTLDGLPVLWVDDFSELTPTLLQREYQRIVAKGVEYYQYEKLTRQWWIQFIQSKLL